MKWTLTEILILLVLIVLLISLGSYQYSNPSSSLEEGVDIKSAPSFTTKEFIVTAYCPCKQCCGRFADGYFANNERISFPAIAAPYTIPFKTRIYIPGYAVAEVKDRGSAIKGNRLDLYFPLHNQAKEWGIKILDIRIYNE